MKLQQVPAIPLAVVRRQAKQSELPRVVPELCGVVWHALRERQVKGGRNVAVYLDGSIRLEVGVELQGPFTDAGDVVRSATPAGTVASVTHRGPYGGLGVAHRAILDWCKANDRRLAGPSWEVYGHWRNEWNSDPSQIVTDVFYLLAP